MSKDQKVKSIIKALQDEAKKCKQASTACISAIVAVATLSIIVFLNIGGATDLTKFSLEPNTLQKLDALEQTTARELVESVNRLIDHVDSSRNIDAFTTLIVLTATRIGAIFLSVYVIQILITVYKYYARLNAFYSGRAIALQGVGDDKAEELLVTLSPENIDFSKAPNLPYEKVLELAKEAIQKK